MARKRGRPKGRGLNRRNHVHIRVSDEELAILQEKVSKTDSTSISDYLRCLGVGYTVNSTIDYQVISELRRQGGLIKHLYLDGGREDPGGIYMETQEAVKDAILRIGRRGNKGKIGSG